MSARTATQRPDWPQGLLGIPLARFEAERLNRAAPSRRLTSDSLMAVAGHVNGSVRCGHRPVHLNESLVCASPKRRAR
jgi:hypothetical protein